MRFTIEYIYDNIILVVLPLAMFIVSSAIYLAIGEFIIEEVK